MSCALGREEIMTLRAPHSGNTIHIPYSVTSVGLSLAGGEIGHKN